MLRPFLKLFFGIVLFSGVAKGNGGATTIGDGGHVVVCPVADGRNQAMLLDLFEGYASGYGGHINFGVAEKLSAKVSFGLERMRSRLNLSEKVVRKIADLSKQITYISYDPWKSGYLFKAQDPVVSNAVFREFTRLGCYLDTVIIHPEPNSKYDNKQIYENLCMSRGKPIRNCFLINTRYTKNMNTNERACLILHEVLRQLVSDGILSDEADLRRNTFYACTGI